VDLSKTLQEGPAASWAEVAATMVAVDYWSADNNPLTEIIWTGPANTRFPVRVSISVV